MGRETRGRDISKSVISSSNKDRARIEEEIDSKSNKKGE